MMGYRFATDGDMQLLAEWNHQLIRDEGHRNPMTVPELRERMSGWLTGEYRAIVFLGETTPVAYALYWETEQEIYLRQLFVMRGKATSRNWPRGRNILREQVWPKSKRLTVEVLTANQVGTSFWRAVGYEDYCLTLEIMPRE